MIRISCIFLKSFFSVCSFTFQCDLIFQVHNAPLGHYTDLRNKLCLLRLLQSQGVGTFCVGEKATRTSFFICLFVTDLEFEEMTFKVVLESFSLSCLLIQ